MITLQEKEDRVKQALGKKARVFCVQPTGQIGYMDIDIKQYRLLQDIMVLIEYSPVGSMELSVVNADLLKIYDEEKKDYIDIW
jgi:hypothetical protein